MERKFVDETRYSKSSRSKGKNRRKGVSSISQSKKMKLQKTNANEKKSSEKVILGRKTNSKPYKKYIFLARVLICFVFIIAICFVSRLITKKEGENILPAFFSTNKVIENEQTITIGIYGNNNLLSDNINNVVISELEQYIYPTLVKISMDYELVYGEVLEINKINNKEYVLKLRDSSEIAASDVKDEINKLKSGENKNSYKVENVDKIEILSERELKLLLKSEDEYFAYNLNFPLRNKTTSNCLYSIDKKSSDENNLVIVRSENAKKDIIKCIKIINLQDESEAVQKYKYGEIDVFFTNSNNAEKLLGKYEYNIKNYDSGENIFLLFNANSLKVNKKEIRKAIAYSIDRISIAKNILPIKSSMIDLPYIYDEIKYKYDIYASENLLLSNGYSKVDNIYYSNDGEKFEINLLVNKDDAEKMIVANGIKTSLEEGGIGVNIVATSANQVEADVLSHNYDIALITLFLNENPNINNIKSIISINDAVVEKIDSTKLSKVSSLNNEISDIKKKLSDNVGTMGIISKQVSVIYRKDINIFDDIGYMSLLYNHLNK